MKTKALTLFLMFATLAVANPLLPSRFTETEFKDHDYFRYFGQYIQKEDGVFTSDMGRVLILKDGDSFTLAFYKKEKSEYIRIGEPVTFTSTYAPHASTLGDLGLPTIAGKKKDGTGKIHAFIQKGVLKTLETKE